MTPLQLTALAGLLKNQGLEPNARGLLSIANYRAIPAITNLVRVLDRAYSTRFDPGNVSNAVVSNAQVAISNVAINALGNIGASTVPALGDSVPTTTRTAGIGNINYSNTSPGVSGYARELAFRITPPDNLSRFAQNFSSTLSYVKTSNDALLSSKNVGFLGATFSGMDNLTTGGLSGVSTNLPAFGSDLAKTGNLFNFERLGELGSPVGLIRQLILQGGLLPGVIGKIEQINLEQTPGQPTIDIDRINLLSQPTSELDDTTQALLYKAMTMVTGKDLQEVLSVLEVTTTGITNMADLLNLVRVFPNSYLSLLAPVPQTVGAPPRSSTGGLPANRVLIYTNASGSVNSTLATALPDYLIRLSASTPTQITYDRLRSLVPADQALASKAFQASLEQIKNINNLNSQRLGDLVTGLQLNTDLPLIESMSQPVSANTVALLQSSLPKGTGPDGTLTISDAMGSPAGLGSPQLDRVTANIKLLPSGPMANLAAVYDTMFRMLEGQYDVIGNGATGQVTRITVTSAGSGYGAAPTLLISGGGATVPAQAVAIMTGNLAVFDGTVSNVVIVTGGSGYTSPPTVRPSYGSATFTANISGSNVWIGITTPYNPLPAQRWAPNYSQALANLCNIANTTIDSVRTSSTAITNNIITQWGSYANTLAIETENLALAGVQPQQASSAQTPILAAFVQSLHEYGLDTQPGGAAEYITRISDNTLTGQAIRACLREGKNLRLLQASGVGTDGEIPLV